MTLFTDEVLAQPDFTINDPLPVGPRHVPGVKFKKLNKFHLFRLPTYQVLEELIQLYNHINLILEPDPQAHLLNKWLHSVISNDKSRHIAETVLQLKATSTKEIMAITKTPRPTIKFTLDRLIELSVIRRYPIINYPVSGRTPSIYALTSATTSDIRDAESRLLSRVKNDLKPKRTDEDLLEIERGKTLLRNWLDNPKHKGMRIDTRTIPTQILRNNGIPPRAFSTIYHELVKEGYKI
jgi:hypothetical protein